MPFLPETTLVETQS